jgi:NAD(P)H-dependent flavin oxidoreductase YrpB (nitropropane dioxygenase family)
MTATLLDRLGVQLPVLAAPMAGGPTTPELVLAAASVGGFGFLAGGYKDAATLRAQIGAVRTGTASFGVNLFAPNPVPVDPAAYERYRATLVPDAEFAGVDLPATPVEDDDRWAEKVEMLVAEPVPVVSFTFGLPEAAVLAALRGVGTVLVQTVTTLDEARRASSAGIDALAVQAASAGGHSGTWTPSVLPQDRPLPDLLAEIRAAVDLPLVAAGGLVDAVDVAEALRAGAEAVMVGTALLLAPEAGTSAAYRLGLHGPDRGPTQLTRAFTGRPARAIPNAFVADHDAAAPVGYPALHHLTSPLRRAATAAGDPGHINLWAGTGYRRSTERPAAQTLRALAATTA